MNVLNKYFFSWILLISFVLVSCGKQDTDIMLTQQEASIEQYVDALEDVRVVENGGVWRVVLEEGVGGPAESGDADAGNDSDDEFVAASGDSLVIDYASYVFASGKGVLYDTSVPDVGKIMGLSRDVNYYKPREVVVGKGKLIHGLDVGLTGAREGEHCHIVFSARHGFGNTYTGMLPELTPLLIEVWVRDVKKN